MKRFIPLYLIFVVAVVAAWWLKESWPLGNDSGMTAAHREFLEETRAFVEGIELPESDEALVVYLSRLEKEVEERRSRHSELAPLGDERLRMRLFRIRERLTILSLLCGEAAIAQRTNFWNRDQGLRIRYRIQQGRRKIIAEARALLQHS